MKKTKRHTRKEMFGHYEAWKQSDQSQKPYCEQHGLAYSTFQSWGRKYREQNQPEQSKGRFIPVKVESAPEPEKNVSGNQLHFLFPGGVQLLCPETTDPAFLKNLINP